jgi:hypothetical protein
MGRNIATYKRMFNLWLLIEKNRIK